MFQGHVPYMKRKALSEFDRFSMTQTQPFPLSFVIKNEESKVIISTGKLYFFKVAQRETSVDFLCFHSVRDYQFGNIE